MSESDRIIGYIENGSVIDHIPPGMVLNVLELLDIPGLGAKYSCGDNLDSNSVVGGKKGVLKVEGMYLEPEKINLIALIIEGASVSKIKDGRVSEKLEHISIPTNLKGIVECPNYSCISRDGTEKLGSKIEYRGGEFSCAYCDRIFGKDEMRLL